MAGNNKRGGRGGAGAKKKGAARVSGGGGSPQNQKEFDDFLSKELEKESVVTAGEIMEKTGLPPDKVGAYLKSGTANPDNKYKAIAQNPDIRVSPAVEAPKMFGKPFTNLSPSEKQQLRQSIFAKNRQTEKNTQQVGYGYVLRWGQ